MALRDWYASFARDFQQWHYRMTPEGRERADACTILSLLQAVNIFGLWLWLPGLVPSWLVVSSCGVAGIAFQRINRRIFAALELAPNYAKWSDHVPGLKEFPRVYAYLCLTAAMVIGPAIAATRAAH